MDNLAMIDVELQFQIRTLQLADQIRRQVKIVHQVSRHVAVVDRLQQDIDLARGIARPGDRIAIGRQRGIALSDARH